MFIDAVGLATTNPSATNLRALAHFKDMPWNNGRRIKAANSSVNAFSGWENGSEGNVAANRHTGGANYAFADGHTKWYKGIGPNGDRAYCQGLDWGGNGLLGPTGCDGATVASYP